MKKIAIIGANSYIARNVRYILETEYKDCLIDLYDYTEYHIDGDMNYKRINVFDAESIKRIDMNCDIVYVFVGKTGSLNGFNEFETFIDLNEKALLNILKEYCRQNSKAKIIFPSTRLVYKGKKEPQKEDAEKEFKTIYAINKFACEQYLEQYNRAFGVQYCIFRICIPYGTFIPGAISYGTAEFMLAKAKRGENISLYGDGAVRRTLTYMGDLCHALIKGALSEKCINDVYNIGGENYSLKEMAELIAAKYNVGIDFIEWPEVALKIESGDTILDDEKMQNICPVTRRMSFSDWCRGY